MGSYEFVLFNLFRNRVMIVLIIIAQGLENCKNAQVIDNVKHVKLGESFFI